jgi:predicted site-specific integrase-resolvase
MTLNDNVPPSTWETMRAFSERTGIPVFTVRNWMAAGVLPYLRTSSTKQGRVLLHRGQTDAALAKLTRNLVQSTASAA